MIHFLIGFLVGRAFLPLLGLLILGLIAKSIYDTLVAMSPIVLAGAIAGAVLAVAGIVALYRRVKATIARRVAQEQGTGGL